MVVSKTMTEEGSRECSEEWEVCLAPDSPTSKMQIGARSNWSVLRRGEDGKNKKMENNSSARQVSENRRKYNKGCWVSKYRACKNEGSTEERKIKNF